MIGGSNYMETTPLVRLGIPAIRMANGRSGVRPWKTPLYSLGVAQEYRRGTCFPAGIALGSSWNLELMDSVGTAIAEECNHKDIRILLGPGVNIARNPYSGRNFEAYGEDPYLTGRMVIPFIQGVQRQGVMATVVMFPCMNQEFGRLQQSILVGERAQREIYLPAFKAAVMEAQVASVMTSYPRINGKHASENPWFLETILKREWGFQGFVMSDWGAAHDPLDTALSGLDLEMPAGVKMNAKNLIPFVQSGALPETVIDDKVARLLAAMMQYGVFDQRAKRAGAFETPAHRVLARTAAEEGMVLLKNRNQTLPLDPSRIKRLAVIGPSAIIPRLGGDGSSTVPPSRFVTPLEGLRDALKDAAVTYSPGFTMLKDLFPIDATVLADGQGHPGLTGDYYGNSEWTGPPLMTRTDRQIAFDWGEEGLDGHPDVKEFSVRWTGVLTPAESGTYTLTCLSPQSIKVRLDGKTVLEAGTKPESRRLSVPETIRLAEAAITNEHSVTLQLEAGKACRIEVLYAYACDQSRRGVPQKAAVVLGWQQQERNLAEEAVQNARRSDAAVIFAGLSNHYEYEGADLKTLRLEPEQVAVIKAVAAANPRTVVVLHNGTPLLIDEWLDEVPALLEAWYPGQEGGTAIARILLGEVSPSGKLTMTFPRKWEDCPASTTYPPKHPDDPIEYQDDIFVGYRHYDTHGVKPLFPFGFGLSYTAFRYGNLKLSSATLKADGALEVSFDLTNTGSRAGAEVAQLYLNDVEASVPRPFKELKGFRKVSLQPGETRNVVFRVRREDLAFWDDHGKTWRAEDGLFRVLVGSSSAEIALEGEFAYQN